MENGRGARRRARLDAPPMRMNKEKRIYVIPGERIHSLEDFYVVMGEVINGPGGYFGSNLDGLVDCLRGGFGTPQEPYVLRWAHAQVSRKALGYDETVRQLEKRLDQCHPSNRAIVREDLDRARNKKGSTVFDWLTEIIGKADNVKLILD
jgi:RNAse (barnase) inhibitor barstar